MPCYVLRAGETEMVKIGWADQDVEVRRQSLQTGHWEPLTIIRVIEGPRWTEAAMHWNFQARRVRGEWFRFHPDMLTVTPTPIPERPAPAPHKGGCTDAELIKSLGGFTKVARALDLKTQVVWNWASRESGIPASHRIPLWAMAIDRGIDWTPRGGEGLKLRIGAPA